MNPLKKLAGQTAIYGLSSIVGRLLNYFLVPLYTRIFLPAEYGVVTTMYAYVTFLIILFTYGMETAYFKFSHDEEKNEKVYSTALLSLIYSSSAITFLLVIFSGPISQWLNMPTHPEYVSWFAFILAQDAITSIAFSKLRHENKAKRFAFIKMLSILINIGFNLFFLILCPMLQKKGVDVSMIYNPNIGVGYVFISNLIASVLTMVFLLPEFRISFKFDKTLWKNMIVYALPLLVAGTAGMVNETIDRILLVKLYPVKNDALDQVGIYGACYKLSILMTLFIQTFRYAAEPFFFAQAKKGESKDVYAAVMKYFVLTCSFIFLGIMLYMGIIKEFIGEKYHSGLPVVPILLMANLCLGVYFNLSIWYKLSGQTKYGAYLAIFGAIVTIVLNILWIPSFGYMGCAWATLICYGSMMILSYIIGQKKFPVNYDVVRILGYIIGSLLLFLVSNFIEGVTESKVLIYTINTAFIMIFAGCAFVLERPKKFVP